MDKNLASAVLLERCGCNNKALTAELELLRVETQDRRYGGTTAG